MAVTSEDMRAETFLFGDFARAAQRSVPQFLHAPHASRARSIAKAVSWRLFGSFDTFVVAYLITGQAGIGATISAAEVLTKLALYYVHERGWAHVRWGLTSER